MNTKRAKAMIEIGANARGMDRGIADARKKMRGFESSMRGIGKLGKGALGIGKAAGGALLGGLGIEAAGGIMDMAGQAMEFEKALTRFQIASGKSGTEIAGMRNEINKLSKATGVSNNEILGGTQAYVDLTGDIEGATTAMASFAEITQASGASMAEIATATAAMKENGLAAKDIKAAWSGLIVQGKAGAVGAKDLAGTLSTILPMMSQFAGGTGIDGIRDLGAALQVVRKGSGSAAEASTKLQSLVGTIGKSAPKLRKVGIEVFKIDSKTKTRTLRSFRDIIGEIAAKGLDLEEIGKVLGNDKESQQALRLLSKELGLWDQLKTAAEDKGAVDRDNATYQASAAGEMERSFAAMKIAITDAFTPDRIRKFADIMMQVAEAAGWIVDKLGNIGEFVDGLRGGFEIGDDTGALGEAIGVKKLTKVRDDEASKMSAKMLPVVMKRLQGKGAGDYASMEAALRGQAAGLREQSKGSILGVADPSNVEATALSNMADFLAAQREAMKSSFQQMADAALAKMMLANTFVSVKMDASTVANEVANAKAQRPGRKR